MKDNRIPAFPGSSFWTESGMTLRQWYAGIAMQGMYAADWDNCSFEEIAESAFKQADAMIKEGEKS